MNHPYDGSHAHAGSKEQQDDSEKRMTEREMILPPIQAPDRVNYVYDQSAQTQHSVAGTYPVSMYPAQHHYGQFAPGPLPPPIPTFESTMPRGIHNMRQEGPPGQFYVNGDQVGQNVFYQDHHHFGGSGPAPNHTVIDPNLHLPAMGSHSPGNPHAGPNNTSIDPNVHGPPMGSHLPGSLHAILNTPVPAPMPTPVAHMWPTGQDFVQIPPHPSTVGHALDPQDPDAGPVIRAPEMAPSPSALAPPAPHQPTLEGASPEHHSASSPSEGSDQQSPRAQARDPNGAYKCTKACSGGLQPFSAFQCSPQPYGVMKDYNHCNDCIRKYRRGNMGIAAFHAMYKNPIPELHEQWLEAEKRRKKAEKKAKKEEEAAKKNEENKDEEG